MQKRNNSILVSFIATLTVGLFFIAASGFIALNNSSELFGAKENVLPTYQVSNSDKHINKLNKLITKSNPKVSNSKELAKDIVAVSQEYKMDPFFVAAVIAHESRFNDSAVSKAGAHGLMQLMLMTARGLAKAPLTAKHVLQRRTNISLGVKYLHTLLAKYNGDKRLALSAYNWGPAKVDRARKNRSPIPTEVLKYASAVVERNEMYVKTL